MKSAAIMLEIAEYPEYLAMSMMRKFFKPNLLRCEDDAFLVMHGTNDIVWDGHDS